MDQDERDELEFLRFYYRNVQSSLGPCDADINYEIVRDFKAKTGKEVHPPYYYPEEE